VSDQAVYRARAELYDLIYEWKPYADEAARLRGLLHAADVADGARVLEAACGTGRYLEHLRAWFDVSGFDLHDEMLDVARACVAGVPLFRADMADFEVERPFDALLCLFSSIGYLEGAERLAAAAACFARALRPGGLLVVEPWIAPDDYHPGYAHMDTYADDDIKLCRASVSRREGDRAVVEFHWLAARRGGGVEHFTDRHALWLCPREQMIEIFEDAGFACRFEPEGLMKMRGLIVGRRVL
jgi:daunosaminyl-N,N-dimethyltransferase/N-dimethyltransferase